MLVHLRVKPGLRCSNSKNTPEISQQLTINFNSSGLGSRRSARKKTGVSKEDVTKKNDDFIGCYRILQDFMTLHFGLSGISSRNIGDT